MLNVLATMRVTEWVAKDLHYRSCGLEFYGLHLLADKVNFGSAEDDLKEAYYLRYEEDVPTEAEIAASAIAMYNDIAAHHDERQMARGLVEACSAVIVAVEEAKRTPGLLAGIHAILDGISQKALIIKGLAIRTANERVVATTTV